MHNYPTEESRKQWNPGALKVQDEKIRVIVAAAEPQILDACRALLEQWGTKHFASLEIFQPIQFAICTFPKIIEIAQQLAAQLGDRT